MKEYVYRCKRCGNTVKAQGETDEDFEKWLDTQFGICPAGGNHVELGNKRDFLEFVEESKALAHVPTRKEILTQLLSQVEQGSAILIVSSPPVSDVPTIHNFCTPEVHKTVQHCGFGFFEGRTEKGSFSFDGGGAMTRYSFPEGYLSYSPLRASEEVLDELGYSLAKVSEALQTEINKLAE